MTFPWLLLASMNALMTLDLKEAKALLDALAASSEQTQARTRRAQLTAEEVAHQPRCFGYHASSFFIRDFGLGKIDPRSARV
jgi:hypothetical protein